MSLIAESQPLRRSARLAAKSAKIYKIRDEKKEEKEEKEQTIDTKMIIKMLSKTVKDFCGTNEDLSEIVQSFEAYYEANKDNKEDDIIWEEKRCVITKDRIGKVMHPMCDIVQNYIEYNTYECRFRSPSSRKHVCTNATLQRLYHRVVFPYLMSEIPMRSLYGKRIEFDERMIDSFWNWYVDPANKQHTHDDYGMKSFDSAVYAYTHCVLRGEVTYM
jgi:hypothetical protein